jgi:hypothetical protein
MRLVARKGKFVCVLLTLILSGSVSSILRCAPFTSTRRLSARPMEPVSPCDAHPGRESEMAAR